MPTNYNRWKNIMKCVPFEEKRLLKWAPPFIVQPKYDGIRCRAIPLASGEFMLLSSEENPIFSVPHIISSMNNSKIPRIEYDGELYCHGLTFEQVTSITSRTVNIHPDHKFIHYHIFDIADETKIQMERLTNLNKIQLPTYLEKSPFWITYSLEEIMKTFDHLINNTYEGIIVRNIYNFYERKRSTKVMKFKPKKEDTYVIQGYVEELTIEGTPKGQLGALVCSSGEGKTFRVGSGFTDDQRADLWRRRETLRGKQVRISYQHITSGKGVPRFPVYLEVLTNEET